MGEKLYDVVVNFERDVYYDIRYEYINNELMQFSVSNMDECPEDAIIGRCLFDAYDYLEAVKVGIELAKQGYTGLNITDKEL